MKLSMYLKVTLPQLKKITLPDFVVTGFLLASIYLVLRVGLSWQEVAMPAMEIDLSFSSLPRYALFSVSRAFIAIFLSLIFSIAYGTWAASSAKAERWLIPVLDILQSIPVLGFLPGLAIAMITLFPNSRFGLEVVSIVMIFTSQVWNMTFSIYYSIKQAPPVLKEVTQVCRLGRLRTFLLGELPFGMIPLVWNAMMSMAGGWFFLMICESFALRGKDFRLPGIGSYMSVAISQGNIQAIIGGALIMLVIILLLEVFIWRPLLSWASRFKWEEFTGKTMPEVFMYRLLKRSPLLDKIMDQALKVLNRVIDVFEKNSDLETSEKKQGGFLKIITVLAAIALLTGCLVGSWKLIALLLMLNGEAWVLVFSHAFLTALRVFVAIFLASLWTIPVGALIGFFPRLTRIAQPLVQVAAAFPTPMLFPLIVFALHWLGIGLGLGSTLLLMTAVQWYLLFNIIAGASSIPQNLKEVGQTYGLSKTAWIKKVIFPALFPFLVTGWTTAAGGAWNASIVAEYVHYKGGVFVTDGLGALMSQAAEQSNSAMLAASLVVMILAVVGLNKVCWKKLATVAEKKYSLGE